MQSFNIEYLPLENFASYAYPVEADYQQYANLEDILAEDDGLFGLQYLNDEYGMDDLEESEDEIEELRRRNVKIKRNKRLMNMCQRYIDDPRRLLSKPKRRRQRVRKICKLGADGKPLEKKEDKKPEPKPEPKPKKPEVEVPELPKKPEVKPVVVVPVVKPVIEKKPAPVVVKPVLVKPAPVVVKPVLVKPAPKVVVVKPDVQQAPSAIPPFDVKFFDVKKPFASSPDSYDFSNFKPKKEWTAKDLAFDFENAAAFKKFVGEDFKTDQFGLRFYGKFKVDTPGQYKFRVNAMTGLKMKIDGEVVGNYWTLADKKAVVFSKELNKGEHSFQVDFFDEESKEERLIIQYQSPDQTDSSWNVLKVPFKNAPVVIKKTEEKAKKVAVALPTPGSEAKDVVKVEEKNSEESVGLPIPGSKAKDVVKVVEKKDQSIPGSDTKEVVKFDEKEQETAPAKKNPVVVVPAGENNEKAAVVDAKTGELLMIL